VAEQRARLPELRERIRRIERPTAAVHGVLPLGIAAIDQVLPGGGLARGALHEILGTGGDEEDGALAAACATGILGRLARTGDGTVLWCLLRSDLYGPSLATHGLDPARLVLVRVVRDTEILWAMEEGLRASGIVAVVGEVRAALGRSGSLSLRSPSDHHIDVPAAALRTDHARANREPKRPRHIGQPSPPGPARPNAGTPCTTRQIGGLGTLEDFAGEDPGLAKGREIAVCIADQATGFGETPQVVDCWNGKA
jgi:hypothetical protein